MYSNIFLSINNKLGMKYDLGQSETAHANKIVSVFNFIIIIINYYVISCRWAVVKHPIFLTDNQRTIIY